MWIESNCTYSGTGTFARDTGSLLVQHEAAYLVVRPSGCENVQSALVHPLANLHGLLIGAIAEEETAREAVNAAAATPAPEPEPVPAPAPAAVC